MAGKIHYLDDGELLWDPLKRPRDENGRFVLVEEGVYRYGKVQRAKFKDLFGDDAGNVEILLEPGDQLWKTKSGNYYTKKADGTFIWYGTGNKAPKRLETMNEPEDSIKVDEAVSMEIKADSRREARKKVAKELMRRIQNMKPPQIPDAPI